MIDALRQSELSLTEVRLLHILCRPHQKPPRISTVARLVDVDTTHAVRVVDDLDRQRYVDKIRDEDDGRVKRVVITPKGREAVAELSERVTYRGDIDQFIATLTVEQKEALVEAFETLRARDPKEPLPPD